MKQLLLIHGALGNSTEFDTIQAVLEKRYSVFVYDIPGHGTRSQELNSFTLDNLRNDLDEFIYQLGDVFIFGFSLGGYLALDAALRKTKNILGIVTLGTKLNWSPAIAEAEVNTLNVDFLTTKAASFYDYLEQLHGTHLNDLLTKTRTFIHSIGEQPLMNDKSTQQLTTPIRITRGGKDKMVTREESQKMAECSSNGLYFEIPSFIHPMGFLSPKLLANHIVLQIKSLEYKHLATQHGKLAYMKIGATTDPSKPLLLFLHEALGSIGQWKDFPSLLSEELGLPAIVLEMIGYGYSDDLQHERTARYLHEYAWEVLPSFLDQLDVKNKLILVGHSDGGTEALLYASRFSNRIAGIITLAAHIENELETKAGIPPAISAFEEGKLRGLEIFHGAKTENVFRRWADTWLSHPFSDWSIEKDLSQSPFPALIIQGYEDQYGTPNQVRKIVTTLGKNATPMFLNNCGHAPHLEQSKEVIQQIKLWYTQFN